MPRPRAVHTVQGIELVRRLAGEGNRLFTMAQARACAPAAGLSAGYLRQALHHLARSGWVVRLRKGLYAISHTVPGVSPAHEFEVAMALLSPAAISHWSAMQHHGLSEQTPRIVYVTTTTEAAIPRARGAQAARNDGGCVIGGMRYKFVQVRPERYFGTETAWAGEARVTFTDLERTLLDGLSRPRYCGDFAEVLHAFAVAAGRLNLERIIEYAVRLDTATAKRLGYVLQRQGAALRRLRPLAALPVRGYRVLDPSGPHAGPYDQHWMIRNNLPGGPGT